MPPTFWRSRGGADASPAAFYAGDWHGREALGTLRCEQSSLPRASEGVEDPLFVRQDLHDSLVDGRAATQAGTAQDCDSPVRCPLAHEELRLEEFGRDRGGTWVDEIPNGNDHLIDTVRYTVRDDVLRGACEAQSVTDRARRRPRA